MIRRMSGVSLSRYKCWYSVARGFAGFLGRCACRQCRDHRRDLPFGRLRRRQELSAKVARESVRKNVFLTALQAIENGEGDVAWRSLRHGKLTDHVGADRARVHAEHRGALRPQQHSRALRERVQRGLRWAVRWEHWNVGEARQGADVYQRAAAISGQDWRKFPQYVQRTEVIDVHLAPRLLDH